MRFLAISIFLTLFLFTGMIQAESPPTKVTISQFLKQKYSGKSWQSSEAREIKLLDSVRFTIQNSIFSEVENYVFMPQGNKPDKILESNRIRYWHVRGVIAEFQYFKYGMMPRGMFRYGRIYESDAFGTRMGPEHIDDFECDVFALDLSFFFPLAAKVKSFNAPLTNEFLNEKESLSNERLEFISRYLRYFASDRYSRLIRLRKQVLLQALWTPDKRVRPILEEYIRALKNNTILKAKNQRFDQYQEIYLTELDGLLKSHQELIEHGYVQTLASLPENNSLGDRLKVFDYYAAFLSNFKNNKWHALDICRQVLHELGRMYNSTNDPEEKMRLTLKAEKLTLAYLNVIDRQVNLITQVFGTDDNDFFSKKNDDHLKNKIPSNAGVKLVTEEGYDKAEDFYIGEIKVGERRYKKEKLIRETPFQNNKKHGIEYINHENGTINFEKPYRNGLLTGWVSQYDSTGKKLGSYFMMNGTGREIVWHPNGKLKEECELLSGKRHGIFRSWYESGNPHFVFKTFEEGYLHGWMEERLDAKDLALIRRGHYFEGKKHGEFWERNEILDDNGKVKAEFKFVKKFFAHGKAISDEEFKKLCENDDSLWTSGFVDYAPFVD